MILEFLEIKRKFGKSQKNGADFEEEEEEMDSSTSEGKRREMKISHGK